MPIRAYKIIGSYTGSLEDMVELVSLAKRGVIKQVVSKREIQTKSSWRSPANAKRW